LLRLLPVSSRDKDVEILALRHQLSVLQRQLGPDRVRFTPADRALLAALLHRLPRDVLKRLHLVVRSVRGLVLRLVRENPGWGYRRVHGELLVLGVKVAPSTVWEVLKEAGIDPAPGRSATTWAGFLRSQAEVLLACDFFEMVTLSGTQAARYLVMDLQDAGCRARLPVRDRDGKFPELFDAVLADAGIMVVRTSARMPRMNAIMERWVQSCRRELLDRRAAASTAAADH
jgi:hypothetical protein